MCQPCLRAFMHPLSLMSPNGLYEGVATPLPETWKLSKYVMESILEQTFMSQPHFLKKPLLDPRPERASPNSLMFYSLVTPQISACVPLPQRDLLSFL